MATTGEKGAPARGAGGGTPRARRVSGSVRGKVRPHDPFELIRWLALSQPDPRKALSELVQNSLDAGARRVHVKRVRERGVACLRIHDDGEGVIPEMGRPEALRFIATHIGHSRKRRLSPEERLRLMTQGQYGIGLLGFWSLGERLEIRTSLPGQKPHRLILHRDRPTFEIEPLRGRLPLEERWTEVVVIGLHREALPVLAARRAADYLASELRGQLLSRDVDLTIEDRISRGRSEKAVRVRPPRFLGERIEGIGALDVPGHAPVRLEIYLSAAVQVSDAGVGGSRGAGGEDAAEGEPAGISVYAAGTLVARSFGELGALGLDREPWTDLRLAGFVDFPGFQVAPGSRRGVQADEAAGAFARAIEAVEPLLEDILESFERRRSEALDRTAIRDLQRAFRDFFRSRPRYARLPVRPEEEGRGSAGSPEGEAGAGVEVDGEGAPAPTDLEDAAGGLDIETPPPDLLPPGPLAAVRLVPATVQVECGGVRRLRAHALDASGRPAAGPTVFRWEVAGEVGTLEAEGERATLRASREEAEGEVAVIAREGDAEARATVPVFVLWDLPRRTGDEGIPEPEFLSEPGGRWRSRMRDGRWQVNAAHADYVEVAERPALKLRYLAMLFAKEVVLRSHQDPRLEEPLEQLVEVAAYADKNLTKGGKRKGK